MTEFYPRDLAGYGPNPPDARWPGGARLEAWGAPGTGPGQLSFPSGLAVAPGGRVIVENTKNATLRRRINLTLGGNASIQ